MTFREAWNALIGPRLRQSNELPASEARQTTPVALPSDVAAYYAECREAERIRDLEAQIERGCQLMKARRIKNRNAQLGEQS